MLSHTAPLVMASRRAGGVLVEYGASDETKAELLLASAAAGGGDTIAAYVPIDVALTELLQIAARLALSRPALAVYPIAADFLDPVELPAAVAACPRLGFFPARRSAISNPPASRFLVQGA